MRLGHCRRAGTPPEVGEIRQRGSPGKECCGALTSCKTSLLCPSFTVQPRKNPAVDSFSISGNWSGAPAAHPGSLPKLVRHGPGALYPQRVFGLALGYEDICDHDQRTTNPVMAVLAGRLEARRKTCAPAAGTSTLNRLEHASEEGPASRPAANHKISHDAGAIEWLIVTLLLEADATRPSASSSTSTPPHWMSL